jgi:hypothetical protein
MFRFVNLIMRFTTLNLVNKCERGNLEGLVRTGKEDRGRVMSLAVRKRVSRDSMRSQEAR